MASQAPSLGAKHFRWAGYLLGFSLAGFFDGILLHQILQWHHLLLGLEGAFFADMRVQILADGLFHAVMYVLAIIGLWLLWRSRDRFARPGADRRLLANALLGFGLWHVIDAFVFHWALGFHRIRMAADNLLFWDLLWLGLFGGLPLIAGWLLRRGGSGGEGGTRLKPGAAAMVLTLAVLVAGPLAAVPPSDTSGAVVLFKPGMPASQRLAAIAEIDARLVWSDATGDLWALDLPDPRRARSLYGNGALLVSNSLLAVGCFAWSRPPA
ncbi:MULTISPECIES: DUF2243 domain-containing protein [Halomonadaceae]|uniref:DUF2243 domain-containing protein n=1 Tax=Halomonadaceae TaxID=28256 RepID=UPI001597D149|nr:MULTISPECIES: DUF2243 domain-containing protein [Halomonas]QJQ95725.1 DUF2243 domain-containing protein [Halomonas sp. PA5]